MENINPTEFKTGGCAEYVYGQVKASIALREDRLQGILKLKRWHDLSVQEGFTDLSKWLYGFYSSQKNCYEEDIDKTVAMEKLLKHAMEIDKELRDRRRF